MEMGRGGKVGCKPNFRRRFRSKDKGSDDSDEDYVVSNEKDVVSDDSEDCGSFLDGCVSEESFGNHVEEEDDVGEDYNDDVEVVEEIRKVGRRKPKTLSAPPRKTGGRTSQKRKRALRGGEDEEEEDEDYDVNDDDEEEEDDEFAPDEDECLDEEEEIRVPRKMHNKKVGKQSLQNKGSVKGRKRRKKSNSIVSKKPLQKTGKRSRGLRRKGKSDNGDCSTSMYQKPVVSEKSRKVPNRGRRRHIVQSDSDLVSSRSSDFEYTISEEEREQIREASELCRDMTDNLRSSTSSKKWGDSFLGQLKWPPRRRGKEKVEEVRKEFAKQICGICLTEEDKRRVQGTLDSCNHYFCFTCIMAWSKVETRCPLCKQRFHSISKPARLTVGIDLRAVVVQVPERDQVYQPSEEEIRGYFDPYENVLCTECHQGGDDALMLLCDSCDSPAHTYCVGLGQEVPEGNWYCEGCRPVALGSSSSQPQGLPDQNMANDFSNSVREGIDLNSLPLPTTTSGLGFGPFSSPRHLVGDGRGASPIGGGGAPTLSGRRWVHRQIQNLLALNRTGFIAGRGDVLSPVSSSRGSFSSQINLGEETSFRPTRTQDIGLPSSTIYEERLPINPSSSVQNMDIFSLRLNHLRRQAIQSLDDAVTERAVNGTLWDGFSETNSFPGFGQPYHYRSRPSIGSNDGVSPSIVKEDYCLQKEQVQSVVKSHLQNFSREIGLDHTTLEDIARQSTHTILAACGLEHMVNEVHIQLQPSNCPHLEIVAAGQTSLMKGCCQFCFDSFGRDVVKNILNTKLPQWLIGTRL